MDVVPEIGHIPPPESMVIWQKRIVKKIIEQIAEYQVGLPKIQFFIGIIYLVNHIVRSILPNTT